MFTSTTADDDPAPAATERSFWSLLWEAHVYFSGTLFVLLTIYCSVNILRLHTFSRLFSRGYFVGLNLCIIVVGVLRPVYLFVDPYNTSSTLPRIVAYILLDTGYPAITTGFAILFLALLRATQIELVSPSFQTPRSLALFCFIHLSISVAVDIAVGLVPSVRYLVLICQGFFIVWSLLLSAGYFYIFSSMKKWVSKILIQIVHQSVCQNAAIISGSRSALELTSSGPIQSWFLTALRADSRDRGIRRPWPLGRKAAGANRLFVVPFTSPSELLFWVHLWAAYNFSA